jgi:hypothetical protein
MKGNNHIITMLHGQLNQRIVLLSRSHQVNKNCNYVFLSLHILIKTTQSLEIHSVQGFYAIKSNKVLNKRKQSHLDCATRPNKSVDYFFVQRASSEVKLSSCLSIRYLDIYKTLRNFGNS